MAVDDTSWKCTFFVLPEKAKMLLWFAVGILVAIILVGMVTRPRR